MGLLFKVEELVRDILLIESLTKAFNMDCHSPNWGRRRAPKGNCFTILFHFFGNDKGIYYLKMKNGWMEACHITSRFLQVLWFPALTEEMEF